MGYWVTILEACWLDERQIEWVPLQQWYAPGVYRSFQVIIPGRWRGTPEEEEAYSSHWTPWWKCLKRRPQIDTPDDVIPDEWYIDPEASDTGLIITCAWIEWREN
jgi:hypothetical protein